MTTILEALQNAEQNLCKALPNLASRILGTNQLHIAIVLLQKGYDTDDDVVEILEGYTRVESVPEKRRAIDSHKRDSMLQEEMDERERDW